MELSNRIKSLIKRLANGDEFFSQDSPRMTRKEFMEISNIPGLLLQGNSLHGADTSAGMIYYALNEDEFRANAQKLGITTVA